MKATRVAFWFDTIVAILFAFLFAWFIYVANEAAAEAVRRYGRNVDSGALAWAAAVIYFGPVALLFAIAATALKQGWRIRWIAHWFAILAAVGFTLIPGVIVAVR
jgi:Na+/H+-dicarboxylate symporter